MKITHIKKGILCLILLFIAGGQALLAQTASQTFENAGTYTFTVPAGVTSLTVEVWGGGGGARGDGSGSRSGGGGGAYAKSTLSVTPGQVHNVVVGAGGTATSNPGQSGGISYFGTNLVVAAGGSGGGSSGGAGGLVANSTGTVRFAGGAGGNTSPGANNGGGGGGGSGSATANGTNGSASSGSTGGAGGTGGGAGGKGGDNGQPGADGVGRGGGGGGRGNNGGACGKGAAGTVIVSWASPNAELALTLNASTTSTTTGQPVTFTVSVLNNGPASSSGGQARIQLPSGYRYIGATTSSGSHTYDSTTGKWFIGVLASGSSATLTVTALVNTTGTYEFTASASGEQPDPNSANNSASRNVTVCKAGPSTPFVN